jgi:hypothetical protein
MAELTSSPKAHTVTWPFSAKTAEDIDYNFDVLVLAIGRIVAAINALGIDVETLDFPVQTSELLQATVHTDTRTKTRVLGDLIQAIGPWAIGEQWFEGESLVPVVTADDTTGVKYWFEGESFEGVFAGASSADVKWDRMAIGPSGSFLKSTGVQAEWAPLGDIGIITASSQPCAKAYKTSNQTIADGAGTDDPVQGGTRVVFHTTEFDVGGFWSGGAPSRLTVPAGQGGKYLVTGQASWETMAVAGCRRCAWIYKNGVRRGITEIPGTDGGKNLSFCVATMLVLSPGDYVELFVRIDNVGSNKALIGDTSDLSLTQLQLVKVA